MSEFHVEVVRLGPIEKHPNADTLSIVMVHGGYPCIVRTGDFSEGDLAVYIPVDALVLLEDTRFSFLDKPRIRAKRLRGIFSMGLLIKAEPDMVEGDNVAERLGVTKWEPPIDRSDHGENLPDIGVMPLYTDIEGLRKYSRALVDGEEVVLTEKVHGCNARFVHDGERLWVGSHRRIKKEGDCVWWQAARAYDLATKLATVPDVVLFGEVYGQVQDLTYGVSTGVRLALFDALDRKTNRYLDFDAFCALAHELGLPRVPVFHRGPWSPELLSLANGKTTLPGASHCREGFVVRPVVERYDLKLGRVILKMVGEDYHLRKAAA